MARARPRRSHAELLQRERWNAPTISRAWSEYYAYVGGEAFDAATRERFGRTGGR